MSIQTVGGGAARLAKLMVDLVAKDGDIEGVHQRFYGMFALAFDQFYYYYDIPGVSYWYHAESDSMIVHPPGSWPSFTGDGALLCESTREKYIEWYEENEEL